MSKIIIKTGDCETLTNDVLEVWIFIKKRRHYYQASFDIELIEKLNNINNLDIFDGDWFRAKHSYHVSIQYTKAVNVE